MALYHFHVGQIKRSAGRSAVEAATYRAGEKLYSEYYGLVSDYTRKGGVMYTEILLPPHAPREYADRQTLWNAVEDAERNKNAQLAYSFDIALQNEFSLEENIELARKFLLDNFVSRGMIADFAVHQPDKGGGISEELSDSEIGEFVNSLHETVQSEGYAAAFERAEKKTHEYPSCEKLLLSSAYYLDGALYLYAVDEPSPFREKLDAWYDRLAESTDAEVRLSALVMVLNRCRANGELERAEALVQSLPRNVIDRTEQLALLYTAQGKMDEARRLWQSRALEGINEAVTAMGHLVSDAQKAGQSEAADDIAHRIEAVTAAAGLPEWMGLSALTDLAESAGDTEKYNELLARLKRSLETPWDPENDPVYGMLSAVGVNTITSRLKDMI